jgi:hypothetical protein
MAAWTTNGGLTVQAGVGRANSFGAVANTTNGATYAKKALGNTYTNGYARVYFNLISTSSQVNMIRFRTASDASLAYLGVISNGKLILRSDVSSLTITSATSVGVNTGWHTLEFRLQINGAASITEVWLDGVRINDLSITTNLGVTPIGRIQVGEVNSGRTYHVVFDDFVFDSNPVGP